MGRGRPAVAATPVVGAGSSVSVTLSCGVASWREGEAGEKTLARADAALYAAKAAGKNRVVLAGCPG